MSLAIFRGEELSNCKVLTVCSSLWGSCHADDGYVVQECKLAQHTLKANNRVHAAKPSLVRFTITDTDKRAYITISPYSTVFDKYSISRELNPQKTLMSEKGIHSLTYDTSLCFNHSQIFNLLNPTGHVMEPTV